MIILCLVVALLNGHFTVRPIPTAVTIVPETTTTKFLYLGKLEVQEFAVIEITLIK